MILNIWYSLRMHKQGKPANTLTTVSVKPVAEDRLLQLNRGTINRKSWLNGHDASGFRGSDLGSDNGVLTDIFSKNKLRSLSYKFL
jgi:hypothetical protein